MTIDHLREGLSVRILQDFVDRRGRAGRRGRTGTILRLALRLGAGEIDFVWKTGGLDETFVFALGGKDGPGNGRMAAYFAVLGEPAGLRPEPPVRRPRVAPPPEPAPRLVTESSRLDGVLNRSLSRNRSSCSTPTENEKENEARERPSRVSGKSSQYPRLEEGVDRLHALARHGRFDEAEHQLQALLRAGVAIDTLADQLCDLAAALPEDADPPAHGWLRDRGLQLWYAWGSQATSGGDGAARMLEISRAEARFSRRPQSPSHS